MDWKKFKDEMPKGNAQVLIYIEGNFYIATFNRTDQTFSIHNPKGKNYFTRSENVYWKNLIAPKVEIEKFH